jgi:tripartite-type tricarboxylate transporter receptor subunit TctC
MRRLAMWVLLLITHSVVGAQECPGPLKVVVGLAPGGGNDSIARLVGNAVSAEFHRTVIVENRVGATGNIAAEYVAKSRKDGCTLALRSSEHNVSPLIYAHAGYEAADFTPVVLLARGPGVILAAPNQPFNTLAGMIEYAKAHPGRISYSSSGIGGGNHLAAEALLHAAGIEMLHAPFSGAAPAMQALLSGTVAVTVSSIAPAVPQIAAGKVIPLAVTGPTRWPLLPDVPTLVEAGYPQASVMYWIGLLAPTSTPKATVEELNREFRSALKEPAVHDKILSLGFEPVDLGAGEFAAFLEKDATFYRKLVQQLQIRMQ